MSHIFILCLTSNLTGLGKTDGLAILADLARFSTLIFLKLLKFSNRFSKVR
jgi:hypothetical protein